MPGRHIFSTGDHTNDVALRLQRHNRLHGSQNRGCATHVVLHFIHFGARLEADAAGVKGNALAKDDVRCFFRVIGTLIFHNDQLAGLNRTFGNRDKRASTHGLHLVFIDDNGFDLVIGCQCFCLFRQIAGGADISRQVTQVAGVVDALSNGFTFCQLRRDITTNPEDFLRLFRRVFGFRFGGGKTILGAAIGHGGLLSPPGFADGFICQLVDVQCDTTGQLTGRGGNGIEDFNGRRHVLWLVAAANH